tara:strand:+ start:226 stop:417 length:192 start_codon:yes stop_codon:yes gene_type:complete
MVLSIGLLVEVVLEYTMTMMLLLNQLILFLLLMLMLVVVVLGVLYQDNLVIRQEVLLVLDMVD